MEVGHGTLSEKFNWRISTPDYGVLGDSSAARVDQVSSLYWQNWCLLSSFDYDVLCLVRVSSTEHYRTQPPSGWLILALRSFRCAEESLVEGFSRRQKTLGNHLPFLELKCT